MPIELSILLWSIAFGLLQMLATGFAVNRQHGAAYAVGPRDEPVALTGIPGRIRRAFFNYMETFPFLAGTVLIGYVLNRHNGLTESGAQLYLLARLLYWPFYVSGVRWVRTIIWLGSLVGILMLLIGVARP